MPYFGAHMSVNGGLHKAVDRIRQVEGQALQIFSRNQRQWASAPLTGEETDGFIKVVKEWGSFPVAVHDSYLINLAAINTETEEKSVTALADELLRTEKLAIPYLIMHPGSHMGAGVKKGLARVVRNLDRVFSRTAAEGKVMILLETTAGQGTGLASRFEEIAFIRQNSRYQDRLGVCLDTCHIFAAGYDFRTPATYEDTFNRFDRIIGLEHLHFFHLNDCKKGLGNRVDRHEHIGKGEIGLDGFRLLVNDSRFKNHPMVLETPKDKDLKEDKENLAVLRSLLKERN